MEDLKDKGIIVQGTFVNGRFEIMNVPYMYDPKRSGRCPGYLTSGVIQELAYITRYMVTNRLDVCDYEYFFKKVDKGENYEEGSQVYGGRDVIDSVGGV